MVRWSDAYLEELIAIEGDVKEEPTTGAADKLAPVLSKAQRLPQRESWHGRRLANATDAAAAVAAAAAVTGTVASGGVASARLCRLEGS